MEAMLVMFDADGNRREFRINRPVTVVGRKPSCQLRVPLGSVSREHCQIEVRGDSVYVRDLGSSNGTFYNGKRVQEAELAGGDTLVLGPVHFTVVVDGEPGHIEPVKTILPAGAEDVRAASDSDIEIGGNRADSPHDLADEEIEETVVVSTNDDSDLPSPIAVDDEDEDAAFSILADDDDEDDGDERTKAGESSGVVMDVGVDEDPISALEALAAMDTGDDEDDEADPFAALIDDDDDKD